MLRLHLQGTTLIWVRRSKEKEVIGALKEFSEYFGLSERETESSIYTFFIQQVREFMLAGLPREVYELFVISGTTSQLALYNRKSWATEVISEVAIGAGCYILPSDPIFR